MPAVVAVGDAVDANFRVGDIGGREERNGREEGQRRVSPRGDIGCHVWRLDATQVEAPARVDFF